MKVCATQSKSDAAGPYPKRQGCAQCAFGIAVAFHGQPCKGARGRGFCAFGLEQADREPALAAAGAVLRYLTSLNLKRPAQVTRLRFSARGDRLVLDEETLRNLEVFRTFRGERGDLFGVVAVRYACEWGVLLVCHGLVFGTFPAFLKY